MSRLFGFPLASELDKERKKRAAATRGGSAEKGHGMRAIFGIFPLLAIPVIIYNLMALGAPAEFQNIGTGRAIAPLLAQLESVMFPVPMIGGVTWEVTGGDVLIILSITLLFLEIIKSTSTGTATIMNHAISLGLFVLCLVQFLLLPNFATSVFFFIMIMTVLDVLAGVIVTIVAARRDFSAAA